MFNISVPHWLKRQNNSGASTNVSSKITLYVTYVLQDEPDKKQEIEIHGTRQGLVSYHRRFAEANNLAMDSIVESRPENNNQVVYWNIVGLLPRAPKAIKSKEEEVGEREEEDTALPSMDMELRDKMQMISKQRPGGILTDRDIKFVSMKPSVQDIERYLRNGEISTAAPGLILSPSKEKQGSNELSRYVERNYQLRNIVGDKEPIPLSLSDALKTQTDDEWMLTLRSLAFPGANINDHVRQRFVPFVLKHMSGYSSHPLVERDLKSISELDDVKWAHYDSQREQIIADEQIVAIPESSDQEEEDDDDGIDHDLDDDDEVPTQTQQQQQQQSVSMRLSDLHTMLQVYTGIKDVAVTEEDKRNARFLSDDDWEMYFDQRTSEKTTSAPPQRVLIGTQKTVYHGAQITGNRPTLLPLPTASAQPPTKVNNNNDDWESIFQNLTAFEMYDIKNRPKLLHGIDETRYILPGQTVKVDLGKWRKVLELPNVLTTGQPSPIPLLTLRINGSADIVNERLKQVPAVHLEKNEFYLSIYQDDDENSVDHRYTMLELTPDASTATRLRVNHLFV